MVCCLAESSDSHELGTLLKGTLAGSTAWSIYLQGAVTITVRYGAQRQQFGPAEGREVAVLDYTSQQLKLMPMLATCYALHFTAAFLVEQYTQAKRTKEEELVADVHSLSAGQLVDFLA